MENIRMECPFCRQRLEFEASCAGTSCKCPVCGGSFVVPSPPAAGQGYGAPLHDRPVCGTDDGFARQKLSSAFKGYLGLTIASMILSVLFLFFTGLWFVLARQDPKDGGAGSWILTLILLIGFLAVCVVGLLACIYKCILLYRLWSLVPPEDAATTPGKAVGFQFIPFFNLYWNFVAYGELGKYLHLVTGASAPHALALLYSWLPIGCLVLNILPLKADSAIGMGISAVVFLVSILSPVVDIAMMVLLTQAARRWRNWD